MAHVASTMVVAIRYGSDFSRHEVVGSFLPHAVSAAANTTPSPPPLTYLHNIRASTTEVVVLRGRSLDGQQTTYAGVVEAVGRAVNCSLVGTSRVSTVGSRFPKDDDRSHQLVDDLLGPLQTPTQFWPMFSALMNRALALRHGSIRHLTMRHAATPARSAPL